MPHPEPPLDGTARPVDPDALQARLPLTPDPRRPFDLVLLDMDGTLVDGHTSWEWVHHAFGVDNEEHWRAYEDGRVDDHEFTRMDIEMWLEAKGTVTVDDVETALDAAPLMDGAEALSRRLDEAGPVTAIVSGGLDLLAARVATHLDLDLYAANGFRAEDGLVTADPVIRVPIRDKARPARRIREALGVPRERVAAMGNTRHDVPLFEEAGHGVAFAPLDDEVRAAADVTVDEPDLARAADALLDGRDPGA